VTDDLIEKVFASGADVVTWHEDRPDVIRALAEKPILGICSNRPEVLKPARHIAGAAYVCHRGANQLAPENTLQAARICFDQGFDFVEIDVRTTRDGHLVVMHDASVDRTTDGSGLVCDHSLEALAALDAGAWKAARFAGTQIPTLQQMLDLAKPRGGLYVEIKHASPSQVLREVDAAGMLERCFFWGADTDALVWMREQSERVQLMAPRWIYGSVQDAHGHYRAQIIEFDVTRDDLSEISQVHDLGLKSMIYSQSEDWEVLASYRDYRPSLVNLDRPDRFKLISDYDWVR
jgi:glycerophosphoryl diester phosphodiesterase